MSLKAFLLRREVLHLYRELFRSTSGLDNALELRTLIRAEFERNRLVDDPDHIKHLLISGKRDAKVLSEQVGMVR
jgi:hypothetical protein